MRNCICILLVLLAFISCRKEEGVHVAASASNISECYAVLNGLNHTDDTVVFHPGGQVLQDSATGIIKIHLVDEVSSSTHEISLYTTRTTAGFDTLTGQTGPFSNELFSGGNYIADQIVLHIMYFGPPGSEIIGTYSGTMLHVNYPDTLRINGAFKASRAF